MIERILVGLDGSPGSSAALDWAIDLARAVDAEVIAVHVFQLPYPMLVPAAGGTSMGVGGEVGSLEQSLRETVKETFRNEWCAPLEKAGVRYREVFGEGRAGPVLEEAAERERADLIVTGRRGLTALREFFAGSVSQHLVHHAGVPVLVIPQPG
jgi:nucleotide-binding universal stress UspA family protein